MARCLTSQGKEDMVGSKGVIKRVEFVRIITKSLYSLGYEKSGALLEEESGIHLHSPIVNQFRKHVLGGNWDEGIATLQKIGLVDENVLKSASFLIFQQKFLEHLEDNRFMDALKTLRSEITPLCISKRRVHELSGCIISSSQCALLDFGGSGVEVSNTRLKLLEDLQKLLPPTVMIPERRLEHLLEQALNVQREACVFHNSSDSSLSLYSDHQCGREKITSRTIQKGCSAELQEAVAQFVDPATGEVTLKDLQVILKDLREDFQASFQQLNLRMDSLQQQLDFFRTRISARLG